MICFTKKKKFSNQTSLKAENYNKDSFKVYKTSK